MKLLSYEGPLAQGILIIWRYFVLNICFIICCVPLFTIGAALAALYSVLLPVPTDTGYVKKFFRSFKANFSQATVIWIIVAVPLALLLISIYLSSNTSFPASGTVRLLGFVFLVLLMSLISYAFPLQARYDNPPKTTVRNAFVLCIGAFLPGILMSLISLIPGLTFLLSLKLFVRLIAIWPFFGFSLTARIKSSICMFVFSRLDPPEDGSEETGNAEEG